MADFFKLALKVSLNYPLDLSIRLCFVLVTCVSRVRVRTMIVSYSLCSQNHFAKSKIIQMGFYLRTNKNTFFFQCALTNSDFNNN